MRAVYNAWYKYGTPPWAGSARDELVRLVQDGRLAPGRAVDLGCGEGDNAIFMAQHGFDVTAVDFAPAAINKAKAKAQKVGASVEFLVDDLTNPSHLNGTFDVLVDYGTFDDLTARQRDAYLEHVIPLARPGAKFLMWNFEWEAHAWERLVWKLIPFGNLTRWAEASVQASERHGAEEAGSVQERKTKARNAVTAIRQPAPSESHS
jgi:cyclopropane fatty-acyl-phospholipid synthase-like methyltransferase